MASSKRGPSVLVTDARARNANRPSSSPGTRFISVDNVLQYASDIPSGQPRGPPGSQQPPRPALRTGHTRRFSSGGLPILQSSRTGQQNMPSRTTKISEKLVLLPETVDEKDDEDEDENADVEALDDLDSKALRRRLAREEPEGPLRDEELDVLRKRGGIRGKSYAERLPKVQRAAEKVSRLTAYCTAQSYRMKATAEFLRNKHGAKTKLYDDCLFVVYSLPLLPGTEGYRIRSRPIMKTPGSNKTVLDLEIERSERRDHHMGYFDEFTADGNGRESGMLRLGDGESEGAPRRVSDDETYQPSLEDPAHDAKNFAELFVFSYGVVVFWNFTEHQERDLLADLTFARTEPPAATSDKKTDGDATTATTTDANNVVPSLTSAPVDGAATSGADSGLVQSQSHGLGLQTRPLDQDAYETEEFHFEYRGDVRRPRVFNDMITLLPRSDHMVKLTISHAIAQSTKLCFFEERMSVTLQSAQHVPKRLALTGELNMTRAEILRIQGRLFESRVQINLSSNVLDVPNFFWDSEPTLHPLYVAIREYLEIDPRIKVLNERCRVFLDLAEILSDSIADAKMSAITWIIIVLIVVSILITVTEVGLRFGILEKNKGRSPGKENLASSLGVRVQEAPPWGAGLAGLNVTVEELRRFLSEREREAVCGSDFVGRTHAGI